MKIFNINFNNHCIKKTTHVIKNRSEIDYYNKYIMKLESKTSFNIRDKFRKLFLP
jgi:hypothetical protein